MKLLLIHFFLNPRGTGLRIAQVFCLVAGALVAYQKGYDLGEWSWIVAYCLFVLLQAFTWIRWYKGQVARCGIEDHFDKMKVFGVWLAVLGGGLAYLTSWNGPLYLLGFCLGFLVWFNSVLVYFHWQDTDPMAPNKFSGETRVF